MQGVCEASDLSVRVTDQSDLGSTGDLMSIEQATVTIEVAGRLVSREIADIQLIEVVDPDSRVGPPASVLLASGTQIAVQNLLLQGETLTVRPRRQSAIEIPIRQVRSIRFRASTPATDPKWLGLFETETEGRGDLLAVRRDGDQIDSIRGSVLEITETAVRVDIDGDVIDAPIDRLEGIIFSRAGTQANVDNRGQNVTVVDDLYGSRWHVTSLKLTPGESSLKVTTLSGIDHEIPLDQLRQIRWASGSTLLAQTQPVEQFYSDSTSAANGSGEAGRSSELGPLLAKWLGPAADGDFDLLIAAGSAVTYRVDSGMSRLVGSVKREQGVTHGSRVMARISVDDNPVWEQELTDADPLGFEIDVSNTSRVRLETLPMDDGDAGDLLRFLRPRLLK